jgi:hypothetical protein
MGKPSRRVFNNLPLKTYSLTSSTETVKKIGIAEILDHIRLPNQLRGCLKSPVRVSNLTSDIHVGRQSSMMTMGFPILLLQVALVV